MWGDDLRKSLLSMVTYYCYKQPLFCKDHSFGCWKFKIRWACMFGFWWQCVVVSYIVGTPQGRSYRKEKQEQRAEGPEAWGISSLPQLLVLAKAATACTNRASSTLDRILNMSHGPTHRRSYSLSIAAFMTKPPTKNSQGQAVSNPKQHSLN